MQLAHPGDHRLASLLIAADAERRILVGQRLQCLAQLVLVALRLRLDGDVDHRLGELHPLEDDRVAAIAQRVAGGRLLETEPGDDVAGHRRVEVLTLVGVHQQDAAEPLAALFRRVVRLFALVDLARVHPEVGELAERVADDLERKGGERSLLVSLAGDDFIAAQVGARRRWDVERARQEVDDGVEHRLYALVLERRAGEYGHEVAAEGAETDHVLQLGFADRLVAEVLLEDLVVLTADPVEQLVAPLLGLGELGRVDVRARGRRRPSLHRPRRSPSS